LGWFQMDAAIHFYGQLGVHAESVEDVLPEWMLSAEFQAGKPSACVGASR
jgi:hypothetical protein